MKTLTPAALAHKKVKLKSVNWWKKKAWTEFSKYIRRRDNWTCFTCGKVYDGTGSSRGGLQAGHFISRRMNSTFFDEENVYAQCFFCNVRERGNVGEYAFRLKKKLGDPGFDDLLARGRKLKQFTVEELTEIRDRYKAKVESLEKK